MKRVILKALTLAMLLCIVFSFASCFRDIDTDTSTGTQQTTEAEMVTIKLKLNGGELPKGENDEWEIENGKKLKSLPTPTKDGYEFVGWFDDDTDEEFEPGKIKKDTTFYAKWEPIGSSSNSGSSDSNSSSSDSDWDSEHDSSTETDSDEPTIPNPPNPPVGNKVGDFCPSASLQVFDENGFTGGSIDPTKTGKVTIINFWYTACTSCVTEMPYFDEIASAYKDIVVVIEVHADDQSFSDAFAFVEENYLESNMIFAKDTKGEFYDQYYTALGGEYGAYPMTVIIDDDGVITYNAFGSITKNELAIEIQKALELGNTPVACEHVWEVKSTTATCTSAGITTKKCSKCNEEREEFATALGHDFQKSATVDPTCQTKGYDLYTCSRDCGIDPEKRNEFPTSITGLGQYHKYVEDANAVAPTCVESGYTQKICEYCKASIDRRTLPALGHSFENGKCTRCGDSYYVSTKENPSTKWNGKTLDVLATRWYGTPSKEEAGTWSQPEFYVKGYLQSEKYGRKINDAIWARQEFIQATYGVTVKWHDGKNDGVLQNELQGGLEAGNSKFHIALPRMFETQSLIAAETVYDLANSKYIDLTASYYNQASVESFSVYGHTFFVAGDFSFVDETTATVIFYNQALSENVKTFPNLYKKVDNYEWTLSELAKWAKQIGKDDDGTQGYQDTDTYGFGSTGLAGFFQSSGIQQVSTRTAAGKDYKEYYISLNDNQTAIEDLVEELVAIKSSTWARTGWDGGYGAMERSFTNGKLLFYHEVIQKLDQFPAQNDNFKVGVLPMPMLYEDQGKYYAPLCSQTTVMCVPKATLDREMSEYFFDVLSWTGEEYVMEAYYDTLSLKLYDDGKTSREDSLRMLTDHIFPGMCYDQGYMNHAMGSKFMTDVQTETINSGSANMFYQLYAESFSDAAKKLNDSKTGWNTNAKNYKDYPY